MKTLYRSEDDDWTTDGRKITAPETLAAIRRCLVDSPIIVEHWFYRGSRSPNRLIFDDYDGFLDYLNTRTSAGDLIHVWSIAPLCRHDNELAYGKCPDENGLVPRRGAY